MANIKSIGGNPIVLDASGIAAGAVTPDKLAASASFDGITAGAALGITGNGPTETAAWLQRVSASDGPTTAKGIHGRTVRWNQLVPTNKSTGTASGITMTATNGVYTVTGTGTLDSGSTRAVLATIQVPANHKVYASIRRVSTGTTNNNGISVTDGYAHKFNPNWPTQDASTIFECTTGTVRFFTQPCLTTLTMDMTLTPQLFDLTVMFGSGNEPSTVAEFEALYHESYYPYDPGSLLPVRMEGVETEDANGDPLQTRTIDVAAYFPDGMRSTGSVYDELTETQAITRIGERAYQSGDESDPTVVTDGTVTHYALATPTTVEIDPQLNLIYRTEQGGIERVIVPTGENSAPPTLVTAQGYTAESLRDAALSAIAPVENGTASTNYGVGSYLVHGGQLCKVTVAIASGEAISIGTNVTATTVMAEVIALIAQ